MKMTFNIVLVGFFATMTASGCSSSSSSSPSVQVSSAEAAKQRAAQLVGGTALEASQEKTVWTVKVKMKNNAVLAVELEDQSGSLLAVSDKTGPFDYDVAPMTGVLTFAQAKAKALESEKGIVVAWEFAADEGPKIWEVYVRNANEHLFEIKMAAETGQVTSKVEKPSVD
jgi:uncharacterized membrane protein YkoI